MIRNQPAKALKDTTTRLGLAVLTASLAACGSGFLFDSDGGGGQSTELKSVGPANLEGLDRDTPLAMSYPEGNAAEAGNLAIPTPVPAPSSDAAPEKSQGGSPASPPASATPAAVPPPAAAPQDESPAPSGAVNTVETVIADMRDLNEGALLNVNPSYGFSRGPGFVIQGNDPRGLNSPTWFKNAYPHLINGNYWNYILPWMVVFEGVGNGNYNTRVHLRNMKMYIKSKSSGKWSLASEAQTTGGSYCGQNSNYFACANADGARQESGGGVSFDTRPGQNFHGYFGGFTRINGPDVGAVFVTMHARLIPNSQGGAGDLASARYLLHVGADYYREAAPASSVGPGVGNSRAKYIKPEWQAFSMTTFSDVGIQEPGGGVSAADFRSNPPPME